MMVVEPDERMQAMERRITRRQALGAAGSAGAAFLAAPGALTALGELLAAPPAAAAAVTVTPSLTEGPYWVDEMLRRADVRANTAAAAAAAGALQAGVPLTLRINVLDAASGGAINGAHVDIWHANAAGLYSDESSNGTNGQDFLRGYQVTGVDAPVAGQVVFKTIWPGWYQGRAIHIHVRVRTYDGSAVATDYTTQIFFRDADNDAVLSGGAPYNTRSPKTDPTTNETDMVFQGAGGASANVMPVTGSLADGFAGTFTIGLTGVTASVAKTDTTVAASMRAPTATAGAVVLAVHAGEALTATAAVIRKGRTLGKATGKLTPGWHSLRVALAKDTPAGPATAKIVLVDAAGNRRTLTEAVRITA
jgi:protocatechuate 3,4-dioxygenase beta subunit